MVFLHYLTTVFENIHEAVLLIGVEANDQYRLILANNAYARITGRSKNPIGKLLEEYVLPQTYQQLKKRFKKVVATKQEMEYTEWYDVPSGRQAFEIKYIPILNAVGQCVQIATITRNVTELLQLREEIQLLRKQLDRGAI